MSKKKPEQKKEVESDIVPAENPAENKNEVIKELDEMIEELVVEKFFALRKKPGGLYAPVVITVAFSSTSREVMAIEEEQEDILDISHEKASVEMLHQAVGGPVT